MSDRHPLVVKLKSGEYNGVDLMQAWLLIESQQKQLAELLKALLIGGRECAETEFGANHEHIERLAHGTWATWLEKARQELLQESSDDTHKDGECYSGCSWCRMAELEQQLSAQEEATKRVSEYNGRLEQQLAQQKELAKHHQSRRLQADVERSGMSKELAALRKAAFYLYCNGYEKGHNDTVESSYAPPSEYPEEFPDILAEALLQEEGE